MGCWVIGRPAGAASPALLPGLNLPMSSVTEHTVSCPYCAERIDVLVDTEEVGQQYIEDCQVCCRPIIFSIATDFAGGLVVSVHDENESF